MAGFLFLIALNIKPFAMILFAYASNMNVDEFAKTVPSAKKIAKAKLPGYSLVFNKTSEDGSSKVNIIASVEPDACVWGVLIEYQDNEKGNFFNPTGWSSDFELIPVNCVDEKGEVHKAEAFTAKPHAVNDFLLPYDWYQAKILKLIREQGFPKEYVTSISLMPHKVDPDERRRARKMGKL